jgi:hypothetical protein
MTKRSGRFKGLNSEVSSVTVQMGHNNGRTIKDNAAYFPAYGSTARGKIVSAG